jgi:hypothetical protein
MAEATWRFFPVFRRSGGPCESLIRTIIEVDDPKQVYQELSALLPTEGKLSGMRQYVPVSDFVRPQVNDET